MHIEEFERLWPERDRLGAQQREQLDRMAQEDKHCRQYIQDGADVRQMVGLLKGEEAPGNLAFQMRTYAQNHMEETVKAKTSRPFFRWAGFGAGITTGAVVMMLSFGSMQQGGQMNATADEQPDAAEEEIMLQEAEPMSYDMDRQESLAQPAPDTTEEESEAVPRELPTGNWEVQTVSTQQ